MLETALQYASLGLAVFPLVYKDKKPMTKNGCKDATTDVKVIEEWWHKWPECNIGIATGESSGNIIVIDVDIDKEKGKDGRKAIKDWESNNGVLSYTWLAQTGRGGYHAFYKVDRNIKNRTNILPSVDIRGNGGYIVAPPSTHPNGQAYEWIKSPNDIEIAEATEAIYRLLEGDNVEVNKSSFNIGQDVIQQGERTNTLVSLLFSLQAKGLSDEAIKASIYAENEVKCNPPLTNAELEKEVFPAFKRYDKGTTSYIKNDKIKSTLEQITPEINYTWDDKGNGKLFADVYKDYCRYNVTAKEWYRYNGKNWEEDTGSMIVSRYAKELSEALLKYTFLINDEEKRTSYRKHVINLGKLKYRKTMIEDAKECYYISANDLDKDLFIFNCQNGVLDLRTFEFRKHKADDLLSKISNVYYDEHAISKDFERFYDEVLQGNEEKKKYLQKLLGYAMTGDTKEESAYILYGATTRNGKSTLVSTIDYLLGGTNGYSMNVLPETLAMKKNKDSRQASGDIARLDGCRFLNMSEPPKRMIFDVALFKTLLGRDAITARHLREKEFEFLPIFKLFINTNFLPIITDDSVFSSNRIYVITFDRHFEPKEQDKGLKDRLKTQENISGIFNWCLQGLKLYYEEGVFPPQCIIEATTTYRSASDKIGNFIQECLEESSKNCKAKDVYEEYQEWCKLNGYGVENKGNFFDDLKSKGLLSDFGKVEGNTYKNVVKGYEIGKWKATNSSFEKVSYN